MDKLIPDEDGFYATNIKFGQLQPNELRAVDVNGERVALARYNDQVYAFKPICPHASANLAEGELSRWKLFCPDHGYCFDVRNGRILWPEDEVYRLQQYEINIKSGKIHIKLSNGQN